MAMGIEFVTSVQKLEALRQDWDAVYDSDPEAQFFLSWPWMFSRLRRFRTPWVVLAARPEADPSACVAFFPLSVRQMETAEGLRRQLRTAGSPIGDYSGFICRPEHEQVAMAGFAEGLKQLARRLAWDELNLVGLRASTGRRRAFFSRFTSAGYEVLRWQGDNGDGIDHTVCPHVELPADWNAYLSEAVSANTRQKLRRFLRRIDGSSEFSVTQATAETVEQDIATLLRLWESQWGDRKQQDKVRRIRAQSTAMLMHAFRDGLLFLPVLRWNGTPVGALAILVDHAKRSYLFYKGGREQSFTVLPPGFCLHAYSIRHAIGHGFRTYDFLRGDEPYKFLFGAKPHPIATFVVRKRMEDRAGDAHIAQPAGAGDSAQGAPRPSHGPERDSQRQPCRPAAPAALAWRPRV